MRIVVCSDSYPPIISGHSTVVDMQSRALAAAGHHVTIIAPGDDANATRVIAKNLDHLCVRQFRNLIRKNSALGFISVTQLVNYLRPLKPDVMHIHSPGPVGFSAMKAAKRMRIPLCGTLHGIPQFVTSYLPLPPAIKRILDAILWRSIRNFYNQMDYITTPSQFLANELLAHNVLPPVTELPMWIDPLRLRTKRSRIRASFGIPSTSHLFGYFGRIDSDKDLHVLLKAAHLLSSQKMFKDFRILLAGQGAQVAKLKRMANKLGISNLCHFTGYVENKEIPDVFLAMDTFVMPSAVETQSLTSLQAVQLGLPAILADQAALPQIAHRFPENAKLFNHGDPEHLATMMKQMISVASDIQPPNNFYPFYGKTRNIKALLQIYRAI